MTLGMELVFQVRGSYTDRVGKSRMLSSRGDSGWLSGVAFACSLAILIYYYCSIMVIFAVIFCVASSVLLLRSETERAGCVRS